ncbi:MAG: hypothetical protein AB2L21_05850 [Anaerolineaceae bacterium]
MARAGSARIIDWFAGYQIKCLPNETFPPWTPALPVSGQGWYYDLVPAGMPV